MTPAEVPPAAGSDRPALRVVGGNPTPEELAAVVTVLLARAAGGGTDTAEQPSQWRNRARNIRPPLSAGPGAWRSSGLPR